MIQLIQRGRKSNNIPDRIWGLEGETLKKVSLTREERERADGGGKDKNECSG